MLRLPRIAAWLFACIASSAFAQMPASTDGTDPAKWNPALEATRAAPHNHKVIFENDDIRVLAVTVSPGEMEAAHHHPWPSVIVVDSLARFTDHDMTGKEIKLPLPEKIEMPLVLKLPPQAAHKVKNVDTKPLHLIRVEFKKGFSKPL